MLAHLLANREHQIDPLLRDSLRWELASRYAMVRAYVRPSSAKQSRDNDLILTPLAKYIDRSEKGCLSYFLGQALTGIYCYKTLDVVQLLHESRAGQFFKIVPRSKRRPDLIGIDTRHNAIVAEAKGRSSISRSELPKLAIEVAAQLWSLRCIGSVCPAHGRRCSLGQYCRFRCLRHHRVGCIASFQSRDDPMRLHVLDDRCPHHRHISGYEDDMPLDDDLRSELLYRCYLRVFNAIGDVRSSQQVSESDTTGIRVIDLADVGITLGVLDAVYALVEGTHRVE